MDLGRQSPPFAAVLGMMGCLGVIEPPKEGGEEVRTGRKRTAYCH